MDQPHCMPFAAIILTTPNKVYFIITFDNDDNKKLTTETKSFIVSQSTEPSLITELNSISSEKKYIIQNVKTGKYAFDNGEDLGTSLNYNETNLFNIIKSGNYYIFKNIQSEDYVNLEYRTLRIETKLENSAAKFTLTLENENSFRISIKPTISTYYWQEGDSNIYINSAATIADERLWKIYEVPTQ